VLAQFETRLDFAALNEAGKRESPLNATGESRPPQNPQSQKGGAA